MPEANTCTVCDRPDVGEVNAALDRGEAIAATARRFNVPRATLQRHIKHRGALPGGPPAEGDALHPEAEPASSPPAAPLPASAPPAAPASPAAPAAPPALLLPSAPAELPPAAPEAPPADPSLVDYVAELAAAPAPPAPGRDAGSRSGRRCACCSSPRRADIDRMLCSGMSAKAIEAALAPAGPSDDAIRHHARRCIPHLLGDRAEELRAEILTTVRGEAEALLRKAKKLIDDAENDLEASPRDRAATITACKGVLELLARILGDIGADVEIKAVLESPRFAAEKAAIIKALVPYPEAGDAVAAALRALDA